MTVEYWMYNVLERAYEELAEEEALEQPDIEGVEDGKVPRIAWTGEDGIYRNIQGNRTWVSGGQVLEIAAHAWCFDEENRTRKFSDSVSYTIGLPKGRLDRRDGGYVEEYDGSELPRQNIEQSVSDVCDEVTAIDENDLVFETALDYGPADV